MKNLLCLLFILPLTVETYSQSLSNNLLNVHFTDKNNGTVVGDQDGKGVVMRTTDGGTHWITKYTALFGEMLIGAYFTDANTGTVVGGKIEYDIPPHISDLILKTTDGGDSWIEQSTGAFGELLSASFCDVNHGIAVGERNILMTTNGGNSWLSKYSGSGNELFTSVTYIDTNTATVVGVNWDSTYTKHIILILRTSDGGESWIHQSSGVTNYLNDVCFTNANNGIIVGDVGTILNTTDGGETWINQISGTTKSLYGVSFADANVAYISGFSWDQPGIILKTTNGGNQWVSQSIGITQLYDICFTDANTGTIVGKDPNTKRNAILRTTDGGEKWIDQLSVQSDTGMVTISGSVKYENNEPAQFIYVQLYGVDSSKTYYTYTDASGNYSVQVDKDFYYIAAKISYNAGCVMTYRLKYYDNKSSLSEADLVEVNNNISDIDFTFPVLIQGTISGTVKDAVTQQPLSNTVIEFYTAEVLSDSNVVYTDQNGNYTVGVFEGNYILNAFRFFGYYYRQYYKEAYNPFDATPIIVNQDNLNVTGIDFYLTSPQPGSNIIHGYVRDEATYSLPNVEVYAIPLSGGEWIEAKTNLFGEYFLRDIVNGQYVLLFNKEGFVSEFYNDAYEWEKAFVFNLIGNQNITANVYLDSLNSFGGEISGNVSSNSGSSLSSTLLSAVNSSGKVISATVSSYNGNYLIPSLENGNYKIKASKMGYATCEYSEEVQIDLINNPVANGVNISINVTGIEKDKNKIPEFFELMQNYPNPFNPTTTIRYSIPKLSFVTIKIYDVLGSEVATLVNEEKSVGTYELTWNAVNLPSGVYFYQLKAGSYVETKKMILLR